MSPQFPPPVEPSTPPPPAELRAALEARLDPAGRSWLDRALSEAATEARAAEPASPSAPDPSSAAPPTPSAQPTSTHPRSALSRWERAFAMAGRRCRAAAPPTPAPPTPAAPPSGPAEPEDTARVLLLHAAQPTAHSVVRLYQQGSAAERRAVLRALPYLDLGPSAETLVEDALRANDTRLVTAAVGPGAAERLPAHAWRHALLKCLFTGVPIAAVAGLRRRVPGDHELLRMLDDQAAERTAAGRSVPADLLLLSELARTRPPGPEHRRPSPESTAPESTAPESTAPEPTAPEPTAPEPTATAPSTPAPVTSATPTTPEPPASDDPRPGRGTVPPPSVGSAPPRSEES